MTFCTRVPNGQVCRTNQVEFDHAHEKIRVEVDSCANASSIETTEHGVEYLGFNDIVHILHSNEGKDDLKAKKSDPQKVKKYLRSAKSAKSIQTLEEWTQRKY